MEYYLAIKKQWNFAICSNMDETGGRYAKWNKSDRELSSENNFLPQLWTTIMLFFKSYFYWLAILHNPSGHLFVC